MSVQEIINIVTYNPLINITLSVGLIFMAVGCAMYKFPPKNINALWGYRSSSSIKNQDRWNFAQKYASKEMVKLGLILMTTCILGFITNFNNLTNTILGFSLMILAVIILISRVEKAIKAKFGNE